MAHYKIFSVRDEKTGVFMRPFFELHLASALRSWTEACNEKSSPFCKFPQDFTLYEVGSFDDLQGNVESLTVPHKISTALEVIKAPSDALPLRNVSQ